MPNDKSHMVNELSVNDKKIGSRQVLYTVLVSIPILNRKKIGLHYFLRAPRIYYQNKFQLRYQIVFDLSINWSVQHKCNICHTLQVAG
jgi:hypothetical protein